jgi:aerotaxis receptor
VFKVLWDHIKNDKPVVAYVKNKTKEGGYYWVLAVVFPLNDQFISIRLKPTSPIFSAVRELYFKLLMAETSGGMESSEPMLVENLHNLGYKSYDDFMSDALLSEFSARKKLLSVMETEAKIYSKVTTPLGLQLNVVLQYSQTLMQSYGHWFEKIEMYNHVKSTFKEKGVHLRHLARNIVFLSLNASVASYKVASGGETFGVLASDIRINAKENDRLITHVHTLSESLADTLNELIFTISSLSIQIEMLTCFIEESLQCNGEISGAEISEKLDSLIELVLVYSEKLSALQLKMDCFIQESIKHLDQLERQVMYLGYIQVYGIIEAASNSDETVGFGGIFSQLKGLIQETSEEIVIMQKIGINFHTENRSLIDEAERIHAVVNQFRSEADAIKTMDV